MTARVIAQPNTTDHGFLTIRTIAVAAFPLGIFRGYQSSGMGLKQTSDGRHDGAVLRI